MNQYTKRVIQIYSNYGTLTNFVNETFKDYLPYGYTLVHMVTHGYNWEKYSKNAFQMFRMRVFDIKILFG